MFDCMINFRVAPVETNTLVIKATDDAGHDSAPLTVTRFLHDVVDQSVDRIISGSGRPREPEREFMAIDHWYTIGHGAVFSPLSRDVASTGATLKFIMQSNMVIRRTLSPIVLRVGGTTTACSFPPIRWPRTTRVSST